MPPTLTAQWQCHSVQPTQVFKLRYFLQLLLLVCTSLLVACSTPPALVNLAHSVRQTLTHIPTTLFDMPPAGQADPGDAPVVRHPRRVPFIDPEIEEYKKALALAEARAKLPPPANWAEMYKRLPKDDEDNIDWMAALKDKTISPSGVIDAAAKDPGKTSEDDIELATSGKPNRMVIFSHAAHTQWLTCTNCHNAIFKREAGSTTITMDAIDDGKYCGVCHDKVALAQPSGCKGCHKVKAKKS